MGGNETVRRWVDDAARLCRPDDVVWCDGSEDERERLTQAAVRAGELLPLDQGKLPGCYLCAFTIRSVEKEAMWLPFFHKNLDYLETLAYHYGDFFSAGGVVHQGMVTVHPVGLPHGPKPGALKPFLDGKRP